MHRLQNRKRVTRPSLPYLDNLRGVLITVAINFILVWAANFGMAPYNVYAVALDAAICGVLTAVIDVLIVRAGMKKARAAGIVPREVPVSHLMMKFPKGTFGFMLALGAAASVVCIAVNCGLFLFYGFERWTFWQFMLYKLAYSLVLSERLISLTILRLVQKDLDPEPPAAAEKALS
ncbi:MAG: hypothetical protein KTQ49_04490 [Candidatus Omnitrophica bacterium]|nr:hypothetical protein [Candidatus Omnitrophota bacterium]